MESDGDDVPEAVAIGENATIFSMRKSQLAEQWTVSSIAETDEKSQDTSAGRAIPVTLITGFLGSGKTTLVRHILTEHHGLRVAVIMNEYGESVEGSYFHTPEGVKANMGEWVELSNGCMCCAVKSEFVQAIETLMAKKDVFDHILIETTGLANPGPVAAALWTDDELEARVQLDSIITVVDAINIDRQLNDTRPEGVANEAQVQVAYADVILLNKMDLAGEEAVVRAEADIRAINSGVHILRTRQCQVDLSLILNRQRYHRNAESLLDTIAEDAGDDEESTGPLTEGAEDDSEPGGSFRAAGVGARSGSSELRGSRSLKRRGSLDVHMHKDRSVSRDRQEEGGHHVHDGHNGSDKDPHPLHDRSIQTTTLRCSQPLDKEKFKSFMDRLLWDRDLHPEDIYRVKGLLHIGGSDIKHTVQAVYELYSVNETTPWGETDTRQSTVVVIGRNLKRQQLQEWFDECIL